jgi:hypothetical protein
MKTKPTTFPTFAEPSEAEIQKVAYRLWVEGGCQEGVESDNWFAARELIRHHHGRVPDHPRHHAEAPAAAPAPAAAARAGTAPTKS